MMQLTLIELFKIIKRPRTYIGFMAIFLNVGTMTVKICQSECYLLPCIPIVFVDLTSYIFP